MLAIDRDAIKLELLGVVTLPYHGQVQTLHTSQNNTATQWQVLLHQTRELRLLAVAEGQLPHQQQEQQVVVAVIVVLVVALVAARLQLQLQLQQTVGM